MDSGNSPANSSLRKTPLNALHKRLGAKMVNFGGWDMPVEYPSSGNLMCEHRAVRGSVGVFDVSHMGDIRIYGAKKPGGALAAAQHLTMNDASKLASGRRNIRRCCINGLCGRRDCASAGRTTPLVINAGTRGGHFLGARDHQGDECQVKD
jgi:glycine cleavage system aminomethyltransferase T